MKLGVIVVHNRDRNRLTESLLKAGFKFTVIAGFKFTVIGSTGGFLREGNSTILTGCEEDQIDTLKAIVGDNCQAREQMVNLAPYESTPATTGFMAAPVKVPVGGAVMFIMPVDEFVRF